MIVNLPGVIKEEAKLSVSDNYVEISTEHGEEKSKTISEKNDEPFLITEIYSC